jgi:hypothetical protein
VTLLTLPLGQFSGLDSPVGCFDREDFLHLTWIEKRNSFVYSGSLLTCYRSLFARTKALDWLLDGLHFHGVTATTATHAFSVWLYARLLPTS